MEVEVVSMMSSCMEVWNGCSGQRDKWVLIVGMMMGCGNTHLKTHRGSRGKNKETSLNNHVLWLHDGLMLVERLQIDSKQQQATKKKKKKKRNASHNIWITTEEAKHPIISKYLVMSVIKKNSPIGKSKSKKKPAAGTPLQLSLSSPPLLWMSRLKKSSPLLIPFSFTFYLLLFLSSTASHYRLHYCFTQQAWHLWPLAWPILTCFFHQSGFLQQKRAPPTHLS